MQNMKVKDFMRPVGDFPRISEEISFGEAVMALRKSDMEFQSGRGKQRILLVENAEGAIVGKLSPMDVLSGLEPQFSVSAAEQRHLSYSSSFEHVMKNMFEQAMLWTQPLEELCAKAAGVKVKNFIRRPTEQQTVSAEDSLNVAVHRFVLGRHDALFVTRDKTLTGILRFSDVYRELGRVISTACGLPP